MNSIYFTSFTTGINFNHTITKNALIEYLNFSFNLQASKMLNLFRNKEYNF